MKRQIFLVWALLATLGCSTKPEALASPADSKPQESEPGYVHDVFLLDEGSAPWEGLAITRLSLRRRGCYGTCPVYHVQLFRGGRAHYQGGDFSPRKGAYEGQVGFYEYSLLCSLVERLELLGMNDSYQAGWTDDETITLEIETADGTKTIADYGRQAPPEFQAFRALFDELVERTIWKPSGEPK